MRVLRTVFVVCLIVAAVFTPSAADAGAPVMVLLEDLNSPKGLAVDAVGGTVLVIAQGAFADPPGAPVLSYGTSGRGHGEAFAETGDFNLIDIASSPLDGTGWAIGADAQLYHELPDGTIEHVLDIPGYQGTDPDPVDQEGVPDESNPYGLAIAPNGDALVADAAGNDLLRVTPEGDASTVARFDTMSVSTDHLDPEVFGELPPFLDAEAVPTSIAVAADGSILVGELRGFPFRPGTSHVWRISPDADGAWCSTTTADADCDVAESGLTGIQDIAVDAHNGRLYVYELAADGVLAFEAGFETGEFPPAVLLEITANKRTELAAGQLSQPGGVAVARNGKVYVTDGVFFGGRLVRVVG